jgi:CheY-like chemotaxis protein
MTNSKLIMVVEDEDSLRLMARKFIEREGYEVEDYSHGLDAFERLVQ